MFALDPCYSAGWADFARLPIQAASPAQTFAPPRGDSDSPFTNQRGGHQTALQSGTARVNSRSSSSSNHQPRARIADAMRQLPFEHRAVIYRAYYQGWTTARIAADLKITDAAVKSRLHDGLRALRLGVLG